MRISLSWLKEFISIERSSSEIAKALTMTGLEVEGIEKFSPGFEKVVVGKILRAEKHPNADQLSLAFVTDGTQEFQVVCGAPNCRAGMKTALALVGAQIPDGEGKFFRVKKAKIRGIESFGMLCSGKELGINEEAEGILEFSDYLQEGTDVSELFSDVIFEIGLTPNLSHASSVFGVARELSASLKIPLQLPHFKTSLFGPQPSPFSLCVKAAQGCPRYAGCVIEGVSFKEASETIKNRLQASGIRSLNGVVDVTNYVLLELGHPVHAFDLDKIEGNQVVVREALEGEILMTLDGKSRVLCSSDLVICDEKKPIALAGIMGGLNAEVTETTTRVLLESAYFDPSKIRKTSKKQGIQTEASKRFERGTDPNQVLNSLARAAELIQEVAGGEVLSLKEVSQREFLEKTVHCRLSRIHTVLGLRLNVGEVEAIFERLHFPCDWDGVDTFQLVIPTYRVDIQTEIDLIEEVARLHGFENLQKDKVVFSASKGGHSPLYLFEKQVKSILLLEGLQEWITCDLISQSMAELGLKSGVDKSTLVKVVNPVSQDQSILRPSLLPGLLELVKKNQAHQIQDILGFEVGRLHFQEKESFKEPLVAGILMTGKLRRHHFEKEACFVDFFDLKGILENLFSELGLQKTKIVSSSLDLFHPGRQAMIFSGELKIGAFGEVHPAILRSLGILNRVYFAEVCLNDLLKLKKCVEEVQNLPLYPHSERDWTLTLADHIPVGTVFEALEEADSKILEKCSLLDVYQSEKLGRGMKNVTFRFSYRHSEKTLEQGEVDSEHARLQHKVEHKIQEMGS